MTGQHHDDTADRMMQGLHGEEPLEPPADLDVVGHAHGEFHGDDVDNAQHHGDGAVHEQDVVNATAAQGKPKRNGRLILLIGVGLVVLVVVAAGALVLRATLHKHRLQREAAAQAAQEATQAAQAAQTEQAASAPPQSAMAAPAGSQPSVDGSSPGPAQGQSIASGTQLAAGVTPGVAGSADPGPVLLVAKAAAPVAQTAVAAAQIQGVSDRVDVLSKNIDTLQGRVSTLEAKPAAQVTHHATRQVRVAAVQASSVDGGATHRAGATWHGRRAHRLAKTSGAASAAVLAQAKASPVEVAIAGVRLRGVYPPTGDSRRAWVLDNGAVRSVVVGDSVRGARVTAIASDHIDTDIGVIR
jgi:hypothetical protein